AEDGIRDATVTGVQTCALPISDTRGLLSQRRPLIPKRICAQPPKWITCLPAALSIAASGKPYEPHPRSTTEASDDSASVYMYLRSEERRVGKECSSMWWPSQ